MKIGAHRTQSNFNVSFMNKARSRSKMQTKTPGQVTSLSRRKQALIKHVKSSVRNKSSMRTDKNDTLKLPCFNISNKNKNSNDGLSDISDSQFSVDIVFGVSSTPQNLRIDFNKKKKKHKNSLTQSVQIGNIEQVNLM